MYTFIFLKVCQNLSNENRLSRLRKKRKRFKIQNKLTKGFLSLVSFIVIEKELETDFGLVSDATKSSFTNILVHLLLKRFFHCVYLQNISP